MSPFKSQAQRRFFYAAARRRGSGITMAKAKEWAHETSSMKTLPERVKKKGRHRPVIRRKVNATRR